MALSTFNQRSGLFRCEGLRSAVATYSENRLILIESYFELDYIATPPFGESRFPLPVILPIFLPIGRVISIFRAQQSRFFRIAETHAMSHKASQWGTFPILREREGERER